MYFIVISIITLIYLNCIYNNTQSGGGRINDYCHKNKYTCIIGIVIMVIFIIILLMWLLWPSDETPSPTPSSTPTPTPTPITIKTYCESNPNPCKNGGKCISDNPDNYECNCLSDYSGEKCEKHKDDFPDRDFCNDYFDDSDCKHGVKDTWCPDGECNHRICCRHHYPTPAPPAPTPTPPAPTPAPPAPTPTPTPGPTPTPTPGPPPAPTPGPPPSPSPVSSSMVLGMNVDNYGFALLCKDNPGCICDKDTKTCLNSFDIQNKCYYISSSNIIQNNRDIDSFDKINSVYSVNNKKYICPLGSIKSKTTPEMQIETNTFKRLCDPYNQNCKTINEKDPELSFIQDNINDIQVQRYPSVVFSNKNLKVTSINNNTCWTENK
jgi:hypothetical protein